MKVIDLAIGFSKGIIPPKIIYKGVMYEYFKDFKDYIKFDENGNIKTFQINVEQFNDEIEIIEDIPKEDNKIERLEMEMLFVDDPSETLGKKIIYRYNNEELGNKLNEIIDRLNGE